MKQEGVCNAVTKEDAPCGHKVTRVQTPGVQAPLFLAAPPGKTEVMSVEVCPNCDTEYSDRTFIPTPAVAVAS